MEFIIDVIQHGQGHAHEILLMTLCHSYIHKIMHIMLLVIVIVMAFFLHSRIWGECSTIDFAPAPFFLLLFFKVEISSCTLIPFLGQDQSTVAQRAETTVTKCFLMSCM